jgi:hypothetical protein
VVKELHSLHLNYASRLPLPPSAEAALPVAVPAAASLPASRTAVFATTLEPAVVAPPTRRQRTDRRYHYLTRTPEEVDVLRTLIEELYEAGDPQVRAFLYRRGFCLDAAPVAITRARDQQMVLACDGSDDAALRRMIHGWGVNGRSIVAGEIMREFCRERSIEPGRTLRRKVERYIAKYITTGSAVDGRKARQAGSLGIPPMAQALILLYAIGAGR